MNIAEKQAILKAFGTQTLIANIDQTEQEMVALIREELDFTSENQDFISGRSGDCEAVKGREAELLLNFDGGAKKYTVEEKKAWLTQQREADADLKSLIDRQRQAEFVTDDYRIRREALQRRLSAALSLMHLRTAQINFLAKE